MPFRRPHAPLPPLSDAPEAGIRTHFPSGNDLPDVTIEPVTAGTPWPDMAIVERPVGTWMRNDRQQTIAPEPLTPCPWSTTSRSEEAAAASLRHLRNAARRPRPVTPAPDAADTLRARLFG